MSTAFGDTAPFAVAVAISPLPIVAVILILLSRRARSNGLAFLLGWVLGLAIAEGIALVVVNLLHLTPSGAHGNTFVGLKLVVGVMLVGVGIVQWRRRPKPGDPPNMPAWMRSMDTFTPLRALGLAALLTAGGNIGIIMAAAVGVSRARLDIGQQVGALAAFIFIGSLTVAATVGYHLVGGDAAVKILTGCKNWLLIQSALLVSGALVLVGVLLVGKGLAGLGVFG